jgi:hypothetical protein
MLIPLIPFGRCDLTRWGRSIGIMPVIGVTKFERFFRLTASIDVDKDDLKRYQDFVYRAVRPAAHVPGHCCEGEQPRRT